MAIGRQFPGSARSPVLGNITNNASFHDFDGGVGPLSQVFRVGTMTDFNVAWYKTVGTILMKAMLMAGLWPLIEFAMFWSMIAFFR